MSMFSIPENVEEHQNSQKKLLQWLRVCSFIDCVILLIGSAQTGLDYFELPVTARAHLAAAAFVSGGILFREVHGISPYCYPFHPANRIAL
jgi:hypothetical protein